jgi:hypothetical protein
MKYLATSADEQMLYLTYEPHGQLHEFGGTGPDRHPVDHSRSVCAKKLPELARGMGSAIKEFQKAKDEFTDEPILPVTDAATAKTGCPRRTPQFHA